MSIVVNKDTKLVVSGLTGREGTFHGLRNRDYGTVAEAVSAAAANTSAFFVPDRFAAAAIDEAIDSGVHTVIAITEGIPVHDMLKTYWKAREAGVRLIGPNCPGVLSPGEANV